MQYLARRLHLPEKVQLEIDEYIPLHLVFGSEVPAQLFCRYLKDDCLLEIGFDPVGGRLCSIKVVQSGDVVRSVSLSDLLPDKLVDGLIGCNIELWLGNKLLDRQCGFDLVVDDSMICLKLSDETAIKVVKNENVFFGCSDNDLLWVLVSRLGRQNVLKIEQVVLSQQNHGFL